MVLWSFGEAKNILCVNLVNYFKKCLNGEATSPRRGHLVLGVGKFVSKQLINDAGTMQNSYIPVNFSGSNRKYLVKSGKCCKPEPWFKRVNHCNGKDSSTLSLALKFKVLSLGSTRDNEVGITGIFFLANYLKIFFSGDQQHSHNCTDEITKKTKWQINLFKVTQQTSIFHSLNWTPVLCPLDQTA